MDGAHGQLKLITSEENIKKERELKITSGKHSAARTGSEQSADLGPNFKLMKKDFKTMDVPHENLNPMVIIVRNMFEQLEDESDGNENVVKLRAHKKKALMFALPNLPPATGNAYTVPNVRKGFIYNGQLDAETTSVPSAKNLVNTCRGEIAGTCLDDREKLLEDYFEEMYLTGTIKESTFDRNNVPLDKDSNDNVVLKSNNISSENRHRAKILSSEVQVKERRQLVNDKRIQEYNVKKKLYDMEQHDVEMNRQCEIKFVQFIVKANPDLLVKSGNQGNIDYHTVQRHLTLSLMQGNVSKLRNNELKAFIKVRSKKSIKRRKIAYSNIPSNKDALITKCVQLKMVACSDSIISRPVYPQLLSVDGDEI